MVLTGCGAGPAVPPEPTTSPAASSPGSGSSSGLPSTPIPGVGLSELGFTHGPARFSLPRNSVLVTAVDQPNVVTLVLSSPSPAAVTDYLQAALPAEGFAITDDAPDAHTFTFTGTGWTGSFTASRSTSAIVLRPT